MHANICHMFALDTLPIHSSSDIRYHKQKVDTMVQIKLIKQINDALF